MLKKDCSKKLKTNEIILCGIFTALIAIGAFIKIPIPNLPFTLQFLFTMLAGLILGAKLGSLSVLIYLILGLIGLPIFTEGGGIYYILKPTFGYLLGFFVATYFTGKIANSEKSPNYKKLLIANFVGLVIVYVFGMIYYYIISNFYLSGDGISVANLILYCFILAVPGDIFLCIVAAMISKNIIPYRNKYYQNLG